MDVACKLFLHNFSAIYYRFFPMKKKNTSESFRKSPKRKKVLESHQSVNKRYMKIFLKIRVIKKKLKTKT